MIVGAFLTEVISQIPALEDHAEYQATCQKLEELERRLAEAKNELESLGDGPIQASSTTPKILMRQRHDTKKLLSNTNGRAFGSR
jgi:cell division septum initiation protein DivIVA